MIAVRMSCDAIIDRYFVSLFIAKIFIDFCLAGVSLFSGIDKHILTVREFDENAIALPDIDEIHLKISYVIHLGIVNRNGFAFFFEKTEIELIPV